MPDGVGVQRQPAVFLVHGQRLFGQLLLAVDDAVCFALNPPRQQITALRGVHVVNESHRRHGVFAGGGDDGHGG